MTQLIHSKLSQSGEVKVYSQFYDMIDLTSIESLL